MARRKDKAKRKDKLSDRLKEYEELLDEALAIMRLWSAIEFDEAKPRTEFDEAKSRNDKFLVEFSQSLLQPEQMPPLLCNTFPCNPTHLHAQRIAKNKAALLKSLAGKKMSKSGGVENSANARNIDNTWGPKAKEFAVEIWQRKPTLSATRVADLVRERWKREGLNLEELPKRRSVADAIKHLDPKAKIAGLKQRQRKSQKAKKSG
jgi:hypothetical protein